MSSRASRNRTKAEDFLAAAKANDQYRIGDLILHGADLNAVDDAGDSALLVAVRAGAVNVVRLLLGTLGVDRYAQNKNQERALTIAQGLPQSQAKDQIVRMFVGDSTTQPPAPDTAEPDTKPAGNEGTIVEDLKDFVKLGKALFHAFCTSADIPVSGLVPAKAPATSAPDLTASPTPAASTSAAPNITTTTTNLTNTTNTTTSTYVPLSVLPLGADDGWLTHLLCQDSQMQVVAARSCHRRLVEEMYLTHEGLVHATHDEFAAQLQESGLPAGCRISLRILHEKLQRHSESRSASDSRISTASHHPEQNSSNRTASTTQHSAPHSMHAPRSHRKQSARAVNEMSDSMSEMTVGSPYSDEAPSPPRSHSPVIPQPAEARSTTTDVISVANSGANAPFVGPPHTSPNPRESLALPSAQSADHDRSPHTAAYLGNPPYPLARCVSPPCVPPRADGQPRTERRDMVAMRLEDHTNGSGAVAVRRVKWVVVSRETLLGLAGRQNGSAFNHTAVVGAPGASAAVAAASDVGGASTSASAGAGANTSASTVVSPVSSNKQYRSLSPSSRALLPNASPLFPLYKKKLNDNTLFQGAKYSATAALSTAQMSVLGKHDREGEEEEQR